MSFETVNHEVSIDREDLLNLLLGQGNLPIMLYEKEPITITRFTDQHVVREERGVKIFEAKIWGTSKDPYLSHIDGKVTITPIIHREGIFDCAFELHLQDHFE